MQSLGLHMIVGGGEAVELERCLKSIQGPLFDQIVVCLTSRDADVRRVAEAYATDVPYYEWCEDFAAARNHSWSFLKTDKAFWLDADDVIKPDDYQKLLDLKKDLDKHEVVWLNYVYSRDEYGNPDNILPRERILPNDGRFKWQNAIHECVYPEGRVSHFEETISIHHYQRPGVSNMARNLRILEREWNKPDCSERMRFYYARDLLGSGDWNKGVQVALECIDKNLISGESKASLCRMLAAHYYGKAGNSSLSHERRERNRDLCVRYCLIGINDYCRFAELWTYLGCVAYDRKLEDKAILYFETALGCLREGYSGTRSAFYSQVPARNLFMIYYYRGDFAKALMYNKIIIESDPGDAKAKQDRDLTWQQYWSKFEVQPIPPLGFEPPTTESKGVAKPIVAAWLVPYLNLDDPANRIRRYNVNRKLEEIGIDSSLIYGYYDQPVEKTLAEARDANILVFTQWSEYDRTLMKAARAKGVRVFLDFCEAIFGVPGQEEAFALSDRVVCCSTKLGELTKEKGARVEVIRDAVEIGC